MSIMQSNRQVVIIGAVVIAVLGFFFFNSQSNNTPEQTPQVAGVNAQGQQTVEIVAKAGYSPEFIQAESNKDTILKIKTTGTFDCSAAFTIPALKIQKMLPPTGTTEIPIPAQSAGTELLGTCSMGMYSFVIKFI